MRMDCCVWCWRPIRVPNSYNETTHKAVCSIKCQDAEEAFSFNWSDIMVSSRARQTERNKIK